jgi:phenylalanyl-tRNA synthetase beta chain
MKISINRLKSYIPFDLQPEKIAALLTGSGLEVEGIEEYESIRGSLEGIVIGEVLTCDKHPNADKLSITTVDNGTEIVPIVCGAPNVAKGQKVVVATEGAMLYPASGEPFQIKKTKIRGEVSQGMICAEDEIGVGESHAGIIVLDTDLPNGTPAAAYFNVTKDHVLEIGLTPNRADAASHLGVARDLKALLHQDILLPDVAAFPSANQAQGITVEVTNPSDCPRYAGLTITNVRVGPSPDWLQQFLRSIGLEPINNIVDITNYILHDLGQPLHAFDADKITGGKIIVQKLSKGSAFVTLDGKERKLSGEELMICDQDGGLCIAGIFGGQGSGVTDSTATVFLESACFAPDIIRKGSQFHGLKTDASFRFERGTDPNMPVYALKRAALLIMEIAGGEITSELIDIYPHPVQDAVIEVEYSNIERLIGVSLPKNEIRRILEALDFTFLEESETNFTVSVKPYRVDVNREADVIEEILRIYGFDQVPLAENLSSAFLADHPVKDSNNLQRRLTELLSGLGLYEIITNSLTKPLYAAECGFLDPTQNVEILNKLSEDLGVMRQTLLFSGLEILAHNINRRQKDLKFFEFGATYARTSSGYQESKRLAIFMTGDRSAESWREPSRKVSFPDIYAIVEFIQEKLSLNEVQIDITHQTPFDYGLTLSIGTQVLGQVGLVKESVGRLAEVRQDVFYADLNWELIVKKAKGIKKYKEISKFPDVRRDLSLVLDKNVTFEQIRQVALKSGGKLLQRIGVFDVYQGEKIDSGKKAYALSFYLQDTEKTLTDKVIDNTMSNLIRSFEQQVGAYIRK